MPAGRALDTGEIEALFRACNDGTNAGARDAAALALMFGMGMRRSREWPGPLAFMTIRLLATALWVRIRNE